MDSEGNEEDVDVNSAPNLAPKDEEPGVEDVEGAEVAGAADNDADAEGSFSQERR